MATYTGKLLPYQALTIFRLMSEQLALPDTEMCKIINRRQWALGNSISSDLIPIGTKYYANDGTEFLKFSLTLTPWSRVLLEKLTSKLCS
jgi:hypothetical protein